MLSNIPLNIKPFLNAKGLFFEDSSRPAFFSAGGAAIDGSKFLDKLKEFRFDALLRDICSTDSEFDNLEMAGQEIFFEDLLIQTVHFIGCSDNGSFIEKCNFNLEGLSVYDFDLSLTNWGSPTPNFGESLAFDVGSIIVNKEKIEMHSTIWLQSIEIPKVKSNSLKLGNNIFMHIFGIILEGEKNG